MSPLDTEKIKTREDLGAFIALIAKDYARNGEQWENTDLPNFLDALQAWLESSDNYYRNMEIDIHTVSPWRRLADALAAARIYE